MTVVLDVMLLKERMYHSLNNLPLTASVLHLMCRRTFRFSNHVVPA